MMSEKLNKIRAILGLSIVEEKLSSEGTLKDGTKVYSEGDSFAVGGMLMVVAEDGTMSKAPEGSHTLENEMVLVVDAEGKITEIKEVEIEKADEPGEEEEMSYEDKEDEEEKIEKAVTDEEKTAIVAEVMQILEPRFKALEDTLLGAVEKLSETNTNLNEKVEKLSKAPAAEAVKPQLRAPKVEQNALRGLLKK